MRNHIYTLTKGLLLSLIISGPALADGVNHSIAEDGTLLVWDSSVNFPEGIPEDCVGVEIETTGVFDISECEGAEAVSNEDQCVVTVDLDQGLMEIPCVSVANQNDNSEEADTTMYQAIMASQRGKSMNWKVVFVGISGQQEDDANIEAASAEDDADDDETEEDDNDEKGNGNKGNDNKENGKGHKK